MVECKFFSTNTFAPFASVPTFGPCNPKKKSIAQDSLKCFFQFSAKHLIMEENIRGHSMKQFIREIVFRDIILAPYR